MKTLAQTKGKAFDWNKFLTKKTYTRKELVKAEDLANRWVTCACGNQCAIIARDDDNEPYDYRLSNLGGKFADNLTNMRIRWTYGVETGNFSYFRRAKEKAVETLKKIEERSTILIKKEIQELKEQAAFVGLKLIKK